MNNTACKRCGLDQHQMNLLDKAQERFFHLKTAIYFTKVCDFEKVNCTLQADYFGMIYSLLENATTAFDEVYAEFYKLKS